VVERFETALHSNEPANRGRTRSGRIAEARGVDEACGEGLLILPEMVNRERVGGYCCLALWRAA
jgi:hypothetical protein